MAVRELLLVCPHPCPPVSLTSPPGCQFENSTDIGVFSKLTNSWVSKLPIGLSV